MEGFANVISTYGLGVFIVVFICYVIFEIVKAKIEISSSKSQAVARMTEQQLREDREDAREDKRDERERLRIESEERRYSKLSDGFEHLSESIRTGKIHTAEEQDEDIQLNCSIQKELDELVRAGASHSCYFVFHNGGTDILGRGMLKMTMVLESSLNQVRHMIGWQGIPRSMFPVLYSKLSTDGDYCVQNINDIESSDIPTYIMLKNNNSKSAIFKAIKRDDGLICGFVGAEYEDDSRNFEEDKIMVSRKADRIAGIIIGARQNNE